MVNERNVTDASIARLGIRDFNMDIYIPLQTFLIRYKNRDKLTSKAVQAASQRSQGMAVNNNADDPVNATASEIQERKNYHQLDRLAVQVNETSQLTPTAEILCACCSAGTTMW